VIVQEDKDGCDETGVFIVSLNGYKSSIFCNCISRRQVSGTIVMSFASSCFIHQLRISTQKKIAEAKAELPNTPTRTPS